MNGLRTLGLVCVVTLLAVSFAAPARAGLLQVFTCLDDPDLVCQGAIGFSQPDSDLPGAELTRFDVTGTLLGVSFSFDLSDLFPGPRWSLNPDDCTIATIGASLLDLDGPVRQFSLARPSAGAPLQAVADCLGFPQPVRTCDPDGTSILVHSAGVAITSVPEPASFTLFATTLCAGGLAGLLVRARRRRSSDQSAG